MAKDFALLFVHALKKTMLTVCRSRMDIYVPLKKGGGEHNMCKAMHCCKILGNIMVQ